MKDGARELSAREREVLEHLLGAPFKGSDLLLRQARTARVARSCSCGCATVDLAVDRDETAAARGRVAVPVQGLNRAGAGDWTSVSLYVDSGWIVRLELEWDGEAPVREFPPPDSIEVRARNG